MKVGDICGKRVVKIAPGAPLHEVARMMIAQRVGAVVVTAGEDPQAPIVGIITDRDIVDAQLDQALDLGSLNVGAVMKRSVLTLSPDDSIDAAIAHMRVGNVRRAPVVSAHSVPVGMVSVDDLIAHVSSELVDIAQVIARQSECRH